MKLICILKIFLIISFFTICLNQKSIKDETYYTLNENYFLSYENQVLDVFVVSSLENSIFESNRPSFYLKTKNIRSLINKKDVCLIKKFIFKNETLFLTKVSFLCNLNIHDYFDIVYLELEYDSTKLYSKIGSITVIESKIEENENLLDYENQYLIENDNAKLRQLIEGNRYIDLVNEGCYSYLENENIYKYIVFYYSDKVKIVRFKYLNIENIKCLKKSVSVKEKVKEI